MSGRRAYWVADEWKIRTAMAEARIRTRSELASLAGMVPEHVGILLRGTPVTKPTAEKLARALSRPVEQLFEDRTPPPKAGRVRAPTQPALPFDTSPAAPVSAESVERVA